MMTTGKKFTDAADRDHTFLCGVCEIDGFSENYPTAEARQAHYDESGHCSITEWFARNKVERTFPGTREVSDAEKAELVRMAPEHRAPGTKLHGRQYGTADEPATPGQHRFAEKLGISVAGLSKKQAIRVIDVAKKASETVEAPAKSAPATINPPSPKQTKYVRDLLASRTGIDAAEDIRATLEEARQNGQLTGDLVSKAITALNRINPSAATTRTTSPVPSTEEPANAPQIDSEARNRPVRMTNRYPGKCSSCGETVEAGKGIWQVDDEGTKGVFHLDGDCPAGSFGIPTGRYAVEHEGVLKFYVVKKGGIYVMASDEEHRLRSKSSAEEVAALILADPIGAMRRYGHEIGRCGRCGRTLTDEVSRANGIGPICEGKAFG